jgi:hypothetical protein
MKIGLLMGILLVLFVVSSCVAPKPAPEPVSWDTYTVTIGILRAGPFKGWLVVADTITATWPGPELHPESEMFYVRWPGPEPVMVINTLSVWTATERAKLGMNQSWGLEIYPRIPHRPTAAELPPMPPTDEEITQLEARFPTPTGGGQTITVPVNTATAWDESPESASLNYEP